MTDIRHDEPEDDMIICPDCGGTGLHPYMQAGCRTCNGKGIIGVDDCDLRYTTMHYPRKKTERRAAPGLF